MACSGLIFFPEMRMMMCLFIFLALLGWAPHATHAEQCTIYTPTDCWFNLPSDPEQVPIAYPKCAFHECEFDKAASMRCPFPSKGTFATVEMDACPDFMKVEERSLPDCSSACCKGVVPGSFKNSTTDPAVRDYVADKSANCTYVDYRRAEIVEKLLGENIDIVVAGDSMMRQNYLRLLQLMRGRRRIFDYRVHTHASYSYCDELDTFKTASYLADMKQPEKSYLQDVIPQFFARDNGDPAFAKCTRGVGRLDFLHAPLFATHGHNVQAYLKAASPTRRLVVLSYVGVWTKVARIPNHYMQTLERVAAHGPGGVVLSLSIPTFRELRVTERAKKYRERNFKMREWVQQQEGRAGFIDFESLSLMDNAPPTTAHDKHYMCYVTWPQEGRGGPKTATFRTQLLKINTFRERMYDNPVGNVWMTEDGHCYDEMNRAVWKVAFNAIMQADTSEEDNILLPRAFDDIVPPIYARGDLTGKTMGELATLGLDQTAEEIAASEAAAAPLGAEEDGSDADAAAAATNLLRSTDSSNARGEARSSSSRNSSSKSAGRVKDQASGKNGRSAAQDAPKENDGGNTKREHASPAAMDRDSSTLSSDRDDSLGDDPWDERGTSGVSTSSSSDSKGSSGDTSGGDSGSRSGGSVGSQQSEDVENEEETDSDTANTAPRRSTGSTMFQTAFGTFGRVAGTLGGDVEIKREPLSGDEDAADDAMAADQEDGDEDGNDNKESQPAGVLKSTRTRVKSATSMFSPKNGGTTGNPAELLNTESESSPIFSRGAQSKDPENDV